MFFCGYASVQYRMLAEFLWICFCATLSAQQSAAVIDEPLVAVDIAVEHAGFLDPLRCSIYSISYPHWIDLNFMDMLLCNIECSAIGRRDRRAIGRC